MADFVDLVHNLFHIVGTKIALGKRTFHKTALQRGVGFSDATQGSVKCYIQLRCCRINDG